MNKDTIRKLILSNHKDIKELMLTNHQIKIVDIISNRADKGQMSSYGLSVWLDISIENASTQLTRLYNKGYLKRKEVIQESGGVEYVYESAI